MKRLVFLIFFLSIAITSTLSASNPKREFRSTWLTIGNNLDWPFIKGTSEDIQSTQKLELLSYLDKLKQMKMTSACFQVRAMGDACYPSEFAPWSSYISGSRGTDPGWDPLAFFISEAHKRGIEAYVWLNPYRWSTDNSWTTPFDQIWETNNMIISNEDGSYRSFNPSKPQTRELITNIVSEILINYKIDGIIFDDYFYPSGGISENASAPDYEDYISSGSKKSIGDWRRENINITIKEVYNTINRLRPDVRFGIAPAGVAKNSASKYGLSTEIINNATDWQYNQIYSDPLAWLNEGIIDFISPQLYWSTSHSTNDFGSLALWWSDVAHHFNRHLYTSHRISFLSETNNLSGWEEIGKQISYTRQYAQDNACGSIYFSIKNINGPGANGLGEYLKKDIYSTPSLTPEITWKMGPSYGNIDNLTYSHGILSWSDIGIENSITRYTVYAIPMSITLENAESANGDGIDVKYLQQVVYDTTFTLPDDKWSNHWYAVSFFDGYGKEHDITTINYPTDTAECVTLSIPNDSTNIMWLQNFSWSNINNGIYSLEISSDSTFSDIRLQHLNITTTSIDLDLGSLLSNKRYYWRVKSSQSNCHEAISNIQSFITPSRTQAPTSTLITPPKGSKISTSNLCFSWDDVNCDKYIIEIASNPDFSTMKFCDTLNCASTVIPSSILGKGLFYWRIISINQHFTNSISDVFSFHITNLPIGNNEPAYYIITDKDNSTYTSKGNLHINNIWIRSIDTSYNNISFDGKGTYNRAFCVDNDFLYIAGRYYNSSSSDIYLSKYDLYTGEFMGNLPLSSDGKNPNYPCNSVIKDDAGNICISNLTTNISTNTLKVWQVNTSSGLLTKVADISSINHPTARIDHISIKGNVITGDFKIYAIPSNSSMVICWSCNQDAKPIESVYSISDFYPEAIHNIGMAPRILPIDDNSFFLSGHSSHLCRYSASPSAKIIDGFFNNTFMEPISKEVNGCTFFSLNGNRYIVYPYSDYSTGGFRFNITKTDTTMSFKSMELLWQVPKSGLGNINSLTYQADADFLPVAPNKIILYLFVPGNGICAYEITDDSINSVEKIDNSCSVSFSNNLISTNKNATSIIIYNLSGTIVANANNTNTLLHNLTSGIYIVKIKIDDHLHSFKIHIK